MAKKTIASLQQTKKQYVKVITMTKREKTGAYTFKEKMMKLDDYEKEQEEKSV